MNKHEERIRDFIQQENLGQYSIREALTRVVKHEFGRVKALEAEHTLQALPGRFSDLVFEDHVASLYVLDWPEGDPGTEIHDHGESEGAVYIVRGTVKETFYSGSFQVVRYWHEGQVLIIPKNYVHKFEDGTRGNESCSLHLYEPPLTHMNYYKPGPGGVLVQEGGWDEVR